MPPTSALAWLNRTRLVWRLMPGSNVAVRSWLVVLMQNTQYSWSGAPEDKRYCAYPQLGNTHSRDLGLAKEPCAAQREPSTGMSTNIAAAHTRRQRPPVLASPRGCLGRACCSRANHLSPGLTAPGCRGQSRLDGCIPSSSARISSLLPWYRLPIPLVFIHWANTAIFQSANPALDCFSDMKT